MKVYRLDVFVLTIGWLSVIEYYVAEARHRHGHDEDNTNNKRRHRNNRYEEGWRPWGQWSSCNAECGTGVSVRLRECGHTEARSQYEMCRGRKKESKICNTQECVRGQKSLGAKLCSAHDNDDMGNGKRYRWLPYLLHSNRCELICRAAGRGFYNSFPERLTNGTVCNSKATAVCIEGVCSKFGCDGIVGSRATLDHCGVCDGDGSSCRVVRESYDERRPKYGYSTIATIPAGATMINITQQRRSRNYLALKIKNGVYIINGNRRLTPQGEHRGAGTVFTYHRTRSRKCKAECIFAEGPTNADIDLMLLSYGVNGGISYRYAYPVPRVDQVEKEVTSTPQTTITIKEDVKDYSNTTYGAYNITDYNVTETNNNNDIVTPSYTSPENNITISTEILQDESNNEINGVTTEYVNRIVPTIQSYPYNVPGRTRVGRRRGNGRRRPKYTQSFKFMKNMKLKGRLRKYNNKLDRSQNDKRYKNRRYPPIIAEDHFGRQPPDKGRSDNRPVRTENGVIINVDRDEGVMITGNTKDGVRSYRYVITDYSSCSRTCGTGRKQPLVRCMTENRYVDDSYCRSLERPHSQTVECNSQPCDSTWDSAGWSSCSSTCGEGVQQRQVNCIQEISPNVFIPADDCELAEKPEETRRCRSKECSRWETGPWSQCSVSCGSGVKRRQVTCVGNVNSIDGCDQSQKPQQEATCNIGPCTSSNTSNWYFNDWPSECPVECGSGMHQRQAVCMRDDGMGPDTSCPVSDKPQTEQSCKSKTRCGGFWFTGPWGKCNATCGPGMQSRDIACVHRRRGNSFHVVAQSNCPADDKPESHMSCLLEECSPQWFMSEWSECSSQCGPGQMTRDVKCLDAQHRLSTGCNEETKPGTTQRCDSRRCNTITTTLGPNDKSCSDTYKHCELVIRTRLCAYDYYRGLCCDSCKKADNS